MPKPVITLTSVVAQSPELVSTRLEDQTALMSVTNGAYYGLDPVGSRVWELLGQSRTVSAVVDQLLTEFEVARPTCEQHVLGFLQKLADADLLTVQ
jgi:hypothetical protein